MTHKYTREQVKDTVEGLGYKYFTGDNYDVNIVGIRNSKTKGKITNKFDDLITISYKLLIFEEKNIPILFTPP